MRRREFLRSTLAGAAALVPGSGVAAQHLSQLGDWITSTPAVPVSHGIDINARDGFGRTVLYYAGVFNSSDVMQYLISQGADVHVKFGTGGTVLGNCCDPMDFYGKEDVEAKKRIVREAMEGIKPSIFTKGAKS